MTPFKYELDTPCLLLDLDILQQNLSQMQDQARAASKQLRPHAKTHKCSTLAHRQIESGAIGVCAAKVSEAEQLAAAGVPNILLTGPVVTQTKIDRMLRILAKHPSLMVVIDHPRNAELLDQALGESGLVLKVLVDVDVGLGRTGVLPKDSLALAQTIHSRSQLQLKGIQAYAGHLQHVSSYEERKAASQTALQEAAAAFRKLKAQDEACTIFSASGTGTYDIDMDIPELTELQVGSYPLMDAEYLAIGSRSDPDRFADFRPALSLLTTVISANHQSFVTVDAGLKALYRDGAKPQVISPPYRHLQYDWFGDEHGRLSCSQDESLPAIGTVIEMITSHCDPTVNQFERYYVTQGDKVVDIWPIDLRGRSQ